MQCVAQRESNREEEEEETEPGQLRSALQQESRVYPFVLGSF